MAEMERHSEDVNKRLVWMQHLAHLMDAMKLIVVCHLARLLPLLLKWAHAYDKGMDMHTILLLNSVMFSSLSAHFRMHIHCTGHRKKS